MEISEDIKHVNQKLHTVEKFSLKLHETTDASGKSQLISSARFMVETHIIQQLSFCQELETATTTIVMIFLPQLILIFKTIIYK
jgi:hypothetical protein